MIRDHCRSLFYLIFLSCFIILISCPALLFAATTQGQFTGSWATSGTQESLSFGELGETSLVKLSGHVNLKDSLGKQKDYWSTCIGLADSKKGSDFRCVWRSLSGQEIYIVLQSKKLETKSMVTGEIVGGTGAAKNIKGSLTLQWSTLSFQKSKGLTEIGGYAKDLKGSFQLP